MKVLVGCPTYENKEYALNEYAAAVKALQHDGVEMDILLVDNSKGDAYMEKIKAAGLPVVKGPWFSGARDRIVASRNILRDKVLNEGYDYFLSLEQDVIPSPDTLQKMLAHQKKILTSVVYNHLPYGDEIKLKPMLFAHHPYDRDGLWYVDEEELKTPALKSVLACHLGCTLIHRDVLDFFPFRYMGNTFDDMAFSKDAIDYGFLLLVDTSITPKHLFSTWEGIQK
jgi:GT2 family glycosyltransferase